MQQVKVACLGLLFVPGPLQKSSKISSLPNSSTVGTSVVKRKQTHNQQSSTSTNTPQQAIQENTQTSSDN
jgi:hypothetical protein